MKPISQQEQLSEIGNKMTSLLNKYEAVIVIIAVISWILKVWTGLSVTVLLALALMTLSMLYFFSAYAVKLDEPRSAIESFLHKLASWACSVAVLGILFRLNRWMNFKMMISIGCFTLVLVLCLIYYYKIKNIGLELFKQTYIRRIVLITLIGFFLAYTPEQILVKYKILRKPHVVNMK